MQTQMQLSHAEQYWLRCSASSRLCLLVYKHASSTMICFFSLVSFSFFSSLLFSFLFPLPLFRSSVVLLIMFCQKTSMSTLSFLFFRFPFDIFLLGLFVFSFFLSCMICAISRHRLYLNYCHCMDVSLSLLHDRCRTLVLLDKMSNRYCMQFSLSSSFSSFLFFSFSGRKLLVSFHVNNGLSSILW